MQWLSVSLKCNKIYQDYAHICDKQSTLLSINTYMLVNWWIRLVRRSRLQSRSQAYINSDTFITHVRFLYIWGNDMNINFQPQESVLNRECFYLLISCAVLLNVCPFHGNHESAKVFTMMEVFVFCHFLFLLFISCECWSFM